MIASIDFSTVFGLGIKTNIINFVALILALIAGMSGLGFVHHGLGLDLVIVHDLGLEGCVLGLVYHSVGLALAL